MSYAAENTHQDHRARADRKGRRAPVLPILQVLDRLALTPAAVVVELGAEAGRFTLPLARYLATKRGTGRVHACDFSAEGVRRLQSKISDAHVTDTAAVHRLRSVEPGTLPVEDEQADAVIAIDTVQFQNAPKPFLDECHRALTPGGTLFLARLNPETARPGLSAPFTLSENEVFRILKASGCDICTVTDIPGFEWVALVVKPLVQLLF